MFRFYPLSSSATSSRGQHSRTGLGTTSGVERHRKESNLLPKDRNLWASSASNGKWSPRRELNSPSNVRSVGARSAGEGMVEVTGIEPVSSE